MIESLEIKDIDTMIRGLENELKGVAVSEIMVSSPVPDLSAPPKVITITEDEIITTLPEKTSKNEEVKEKIIEEKEIFAAPITTEDKITNPAQEESPIIVETDPYLENFENLVKKIYDRDYDLGTCFTQNITFNKFEDNKLTWESQAEEADKKTLITHWATIHMFVKECFGLETKIVNISKKKVVNTLTSSTSINSATLPATKKVAEPTETIETKPPHIEDIEMKSSCIAPPAGDTEAAKEKDPSTLLQEPMIKEAIALFDPKKVRIKKNI